jgi:leucyl-tRNA synthetase
MSKSKGNFLTINDLVELYGADASRITLADCGDSLDDANFLREICNLSINRLYSFENFVKILINEVWNKMDLKINNPDGEIQFNNLFDRIFDNNINYLIKEAKKSYEEMKYKNVLKFAFYEMINIKDQYILFNLDDYTKLNPTLMIKFLKTFFIINNPIIPHFTEYMYITYLNPIFEKFNLNDKKIVFLHNAKYPIISSEIDMKLFDYNKYLNKVIQSIRETASRKNRKKSNNEKNEEKKGIKIKVLYSKEYSPIQKQVLQILRREYNNENNKISLSKKYKDEILSNNEIEQNLKTKMLEFSAFKAKEVESIGLEALNENLKFNEEEVLKNNVELFKKLAKLEEIEFAEYNENNKPKGCKDAAIPGKPLVIQL